MEGKVRKMFDQNLLQQAIESAKCRIYRLKANQGESLAHQMKAKNQIELQKITVAALEKQIAKELLECNKISGLGKCPCCQSRIEGHHNYCWHCGQQVKG